MICATFHVGTDGNIHGFTVKGHSTEHAEDLNGKLVCAAVSSAVIMAANTVTEIVGAKALAHSADGLLRLFIQNRFSDCQTALRGCRLHLEGLAEEYPEKIRVIQEEMNE